MSLSQLLEIIPMDILEKLGIDILKDLPLHELASKDFHRLSCLYDEDAFSEVNHQFWATIRIVAFTSLGLSALTTASSVLIALVIGVTISAICLPISAIAQGIAILAIIATLFIKARLQTQDRKEIRQTRESIFNDGKGRFSPKIHRTTSQNPIQRKGRLRAKTAYSEREWNDTARRFST